MSMQSLCEQCGASTEVVYVRGNRYCKDCLFHAVDEGQLQKLILSCLNCEDDIEDDERVMCESCAKCSGGCDYYAVYCEDCSSNDGESSCDYCGEYDGVCCYECAKREWELVDAEHVPCNECGDNASQFYCLACDDDRAWKDGSGQVKAAEDGTFTVGDTSVVWN